MMESIFSLRFLLLLVGAAIVAGIYMLGSRKNNRNKRVRVEQRRPTFKPRRRTGAQATTQAATDAVLLDPRARDDGPPEHDESLRPHHDDIIVPVDEPDLELPKITRSGDTESPAPRRTRENQMELTFDDDPVPGPAEDVEQTLIALFVRSPEGEEFAGAAIVKSMNAVGLRYGDMKIFHHYGAGELRTTAPLFSVANMVEPGHFELDNVDRFSTPGLAMFLQLPGPLDGAVAFELFLNTAQRLAEALNGDLYSTPETLLDGVGIDRMRQQATPHTNVR